MDQIFIKGLRINAIIGILEHERLYEQPLILDITLQHDIRASAKTGDLDLSINYAQLSADVTEFVRDQKERLLETLAENTCSFILERYRPAAVTLSVMKTHAVPDTDGVGVCITRKREDK